MAKKKKKNNRKNVKSSVRGQREQRRSFAERHPRLQKAAARLQKVAARLQKVAGKAANGFLSILSIILKPLKPLISIENCFAALLAVLLFYPPFFRGLYFDQELLPTHIFTAVLFAFFAFYKIYRREPLFSRHPLDCAVVLLLILYIASSIGAWNTRDALGAVLKMTNYAAVYWLLSYSLRSVKAGRNYLLVFFACGVGVALLGLGAALGTFHYNDAFVNGRVYSSLQYPHTLAAFLTAMNLFGLYLWAEARPPAAKVLLAAGNYLLFLTILGTQSQGAFIFYPIAFLILLIGLPGNMRKRILGQFVLQVAASAAVYGGFMACANGGARAAGWLWLLAGAALVSLLQLAWNHLEQRAAAAANKKRPWRRIAVGVFLVLAIVGGGYALLKNTPNSTASENQAAWRSWAQRIQTISLKQRQAQERILFSRDAFRIMASSPRNALLGAGGGGWKALHHQFQEYYSVPTEVRNHFLQLGVETGFPGLLTFIAIWVLFLLSTRRAMHPPDDKPRHEIRSLSWTVCSGALALGMYSLIDFNLSLSAVAILLWGLFGLGRGLERLSGLAAEPRAVEVKGKERRKRSKQQPETWRQSRTFQGVVVSVIFCTYFFISVNLILGQKYAQAATESLKNNMQDTQAATSNLEAAINHDPWTSSHRSTLANLLLYNYQTMEQKDTALIKKAQDNLETAVRNDRGNEELRILYAQALFNSGSVDEGLQQLEKAVQLVPLLQNNYEYLAAGYMNAGRFMLEQAEQQRETNEQTGDMEKLREKGRKYLQSAAAVPDRLEKRMAAVPQKYLDYWSIQPYLEVTPSISLNAGKSLVLLGSWQQADPYLNAALEDSQLQSEANLWRGLALEKQQKDGEELISEALAAQPELADERESIEALLTAPGA
jgi:Tfp pilus assembly protein PilF